ncbi:hypothetical protein Poli38472_005834 [Pythium oligandrum]|uniref:RRM domain-containing protein n=1 Tax=Pythium oligandrum TaxID=41045 RepID=A0A8K1CTK2_PYTOL|nr:hypothetical protein Poli38472_005834 [Pythium oligandrum]|eukprot:TMW68366.1 hypothetical protein Poli38472_005834 [Pythium oligandrum]
MADPVEKKLGMTLEEIADERKGQLSPSQGGKSKNTKRADRLAQTGPYPPRNARYGVGETPGNGEGGDGGAGRRVYVGNLSWNVKWQDLKDHMRAAGEVERASIMESNGRSKGCGLVTYVTEVDAHRAIETLNDTELDGRKIFVREDREESTPNWTRATKGCRVYVGNLSWNVKWQDLKDHMKLAGTVVHADVLEEPNGRSKGCGLVEYSTPDEAQHAIMSLNDTELEGRKIFVREDREPDGGSISSIAKRAGGRGAGGFGGPPSFGRVGVPPPQRVFVPGIEGTTLYVGNLPWDINWQNLKDLFRTVGEVDRAEVPQLPDGRSRGFGIIRFVHPEDAIRAIEQLNGRDLNGRTIEVRYDKGR